MLRTSADASARANHGRRLRGFDAPAGRCIAHSPLLVNTASRKFSALLCGVITAVACSLTCTPPAPALHRCPEPVWKAYSPLQTYQVREEAARLEALLAAGDTALPDSGVSADPVDTAAVKKLSGIGIRQRLFELSIHHANPDYNLDKIFDYASFLYQNGGPDSLRYLNWGRVVREQKRLMQERDSLVKVIDAVAEGEKRESQSAEKLKKELKAFSQQRDSLTAVIGNQQETIMKLQKLDVMMEQQRSKIQ